MRARHLAALAASALLLPGCIAMFGVKGDGLAKRVQELEARIAELEKARGGMQGCMVLTGDAGEWIRPEGGEVEAVEMEDLEMEDANIEEVEVEISK